MQGEEKTANPLDAAMAEALAAVEKRENDEPTAQGSQPAVAEATSENTTPDAKELLAKAEEEKAELKNQLLRVAADFENYRKRSNRDVEEARKYGIERLLRDVLPVLDNLDRALQHVQDEKNPVITGVRMVAKQFTDILGRFGVVGFDSVGTPFDPERHEAVSQAPNADVTPGTVLSELQRGYMIHDRLLRAASVVVATTPVEPSSTNDASPEGSQA